MPDETARSTPAPTEVPLAEIGPRVYGVFDLTRPDRVAGWAIDRASSAAAVEVEIRREGKLVATVRADRHRADLEKGGIGTGDYGFGATISPPVEPGFEFTVTAIARAADGTPGELKRGGSKGAAVAPEQRVVERVYEEVLRLRHSQPAAREPGNDVDRLADLVNRVEMVQIRLEAALAGARRPEGRASDGGLRLILTGTAAIALGSLGLGLYSLFA
ncbi:MAG: hypothetical protein ABTQ27_15290 [Amaricoccus sp.]|uniref:hypothetical protein n=1 Tax=Amaricoccus sp. TaxID=1872485 RepID=UPI003315FAE0